MGMKFPWDLWNSDTDRVALLCRVAEASGGALLVLDALGNVVFLNEPAEALWGEEAAALVNRAGISLLGFDRSRQQADDFGAALNEGRNWSGAAKVVREIGSGRAALRQVNMEIVAREGRGGRRRVLGAIVTLSAAVRRKSGK